MRVVALYRVSSEKQETEGASLDAQRRRYRELAAAYRTAEHEATGELRAAEGRASALRRQLAVVRDGHHERQVLAVARLATTAKLNARAQRTALLALVERIDATVRDRGPQPRAGGRWASRAEPRWGLDEVYLRLRVGGLAAPTSECVRSCITVHIASGGQVLEPVAHQYAERAKENA